MFFSSTGRDDSYITYWPAYTLSNFGEIINYNGDRVEQSSSLSQTLFLALANKTSGLDMVLLGKLSSIVFGIACLIVVYRLALKINKKIALTAAFLAGTSQFLVYWSFSGMETTMTAFAGLLIIVTYANFLIKKNFSFMSLANACMATILFILVRPEEPIVLAFLTIGTFMLLLAKRRIKRGEPEEREYLNRQLSRLSILAGLSLSAIGALFLFRHWYFDSWFPQPVYAKSSGLSLASIKGGILYLGDLFMIQKAGPSALLLLLATAAFFFTLWKNRRMEKVTTPVILAAIYVFVYTAFVVFSGGDWMESGRLVVPFLPVVLIFIPLAVTYLPNIRKFFNPVMLTILLLAFSGTVYCMKISTGSPAWSRVTADFDISEYHWFERHNGQNLRDINILNNLKRAIADVAPRKDGPINLFSGEMGMVPYYIAKENYGKVKFLDRMGLTERTITGCNLLKPKKYRLGLNFPIDEYFDNKVILEEECGAIDPDIIYGLGIEKKGETINQNGYMVAYVQGSYTISGFLDERSVNSEEFVAIKKGL